MPKLDIPKYYYEKVWWQCKKYKDHVWEATPANRHKRKLGCDFCEKRRASKLYNLESEYPKIASEWHPEKNGDLKPCDIMRTLKEELIWSNEFNTFDELSVALDDWIDEYNHKYCHSSIGYLPPAVFEKQWMKDYALTPLIAA